MAKQKKSKGRVVDFNKALEEKEKKKKQQERIAQQEEEPVEISEVTEASVKRRKKQQRRRYGIYAVFLVAALVVVGFLAHNIVALKVEQNELKSKQTELEKKKKELKEEKKTVSDPDYIEEQARKKLKMIKPGEILYVLPDEDKNKEDKKAGDK